MPGQHLFIEYVREDPQFFWAVCITVILSICIHELAHGVVAIRLGDRTPIETGHMTFNPLVHMGGMSLILLLMAGIAWGAMPVNPARLRGRYGPALVALAGPASNVILALLALGTLGLLERWDYGDLDNVEAFSSHLRNLLWVFGYTNVALAIFNLLPVPPLDGSRVLANLSAPFAQLMQSMRQGGGAGIVFVLVFLFAGQLIFPAAASVANGFLEFIRGN